MSEHQRKAPFQQRKPNDHSQEQTAALRWNPWVRYGLLAATTVAIALMFPGSSLVQDRYEVGSIWYGDTIRAPFAFPLYKDEKDYKRDTKRAADSILPVYVPTGFTAVRIEDTLRKTVAAIAASPSPPGFLSERSKAFLAQLPTGNPQLPASNARLPILTRIGDALVAGVNAPYSAGVISTNKAEVPQERLLIRRSEVYEEALPINALYDSLSALQVVEAGLARTLTPEEAAFAVDVFISVYQPTYQYDPRLTEETRRDAVTSVPMTQGIVAEGELIVATGSKITEATALKLGSYQRSLQLREVDEKPLRQIGGNLLYVIILIGMGALFLISYRPRIFHDNLQLGIICALLLVIALMAFVTMMIRSTLPLEFLILLPFFAIIISILFDSRTAFRWLVIGVLVVAGIRGNDFTIAIAGLAAGVLAIFTVRDIKSRTQLFRSIAFSMLGYTIAILALGLERADSLADMSLQLGFAAINAVISPVLTFGVILLIENLFNIATDLKLLEYDDLNHPLLRALADKAPGTYQHTLTIARLAESASVAINANPLLAKVGSYFHDIGKIGRAEYFVENQMQMGNKHDRIKPEMSARMIREHVIAGMELARQYKLPRRIADFIPMHHGTTLIQYFYDKAKETNPGVAEEDFRYPGPLPHSRETAIVMLADAVEATTRSLPNPTPKAIEETIDRIIKKRFSEGQLDHCELTLADLNRIKTAFLKNLIGMSHPRVQYKPEQPQAPPAEEVAQKAKRAARQEPVIPYIDDAFGNLDGEEEHRAS
ncbi:MAG: HDIG domain-containing protein [Chlorobi bacterium CHB2]|nr:HDIG domain-containing protein [Chlorobi bacterium CHB2]